jgi:lipoprotein-releasing system permease protein
LLYSLYIAKRYIFSKKSHNAINVISGISVCGVAFATAALVCVLSVFNGFRDMISSLFTAFDPQLKVVPVEGKYVPADNSALEKIKDYKLIDTYSEVVEDNALVMIANMQAMVTVKGVEDNFTEIAGIDSILTGDKKFELRADVLDYCIMGNGVRAKLGLPADMEIDIPLSVFAPRKGERIDLNDPTESFSHEKAYISNTGFEVRQNKYDSNYILTSISFARRLFERQGYLTAVELRLKPGTDIQKAKKSIQQLAGDSFRVEDRYEQQEETFKIMNIEKLISFVFLTFILAIACFNIIGSLSMLIIDKKQDVRTMINLGASQKQISWIFLLEGWLISIIGAVAGILIGLMLCWIQDRYGLISFGSSEGSYIIDAYPVSVHFWDIVLVFATVVTVGFASVCYPVWYMSRKLTENNRA